MKGPKYGEEKSPISYIERVVKIAEAATLIALGAGCATDNWREYKEAELPRSEVACIRADKDVFIQGVDGSKSNAWGGASQEKEVYVLA